MAHKPKSSGEGYILKRHNLITTLSEGEVKDAKSRFGDDHKAKWFRSSDVVAGMDGAIYIADWYDRLVGGHRMMDSTGYGRVYRITPLGKNLVNREGVLKEAVFLDPGEPLITDEELQNIRMLLKN